MKIGFFNQAYRLYLWSRVVSLVNLGANEEALVLLSKYQELGELDLKAVILKATIFYWLKDFESASKLYDDCWNQIEASILPVEDKKYLKYYVGFFGYEAAKGTTISFKNIQSIKSLDINAGLVNRKWKKLFKLPQRQKKYLWNLIPGKSVGPLQFGERVEDYVRTYGLLSVKYDEEHIQAFEVPDNNVFITVQEDKIFDVSCFEECLYKGRNLIGIDLPSIIDVLGCQPDLTNQPIDNSGELRFPVLFKQHSIIVYVEGEDKKVDTVQCFNPESLLVALEH